MDHRIFEQQVRLHRDRVYGLACYLVGAQADAEDVTQEVFLRLWQKRKNIDETRVLGWLLRVTRNCCIDLHRKRKSTIVHLNPVEYIDETIAGNFRGPDESAEQALFASSLKKAITKLSDPYRSIIVLREIHELKYDEIADILDLPLNTIKVYLHRARAKLREDLINSNTIAPSTLKNVNH